MAAGCDTAGTTEAHRVYTANLTQRSHEIVAIAAAVAFKFLGAAACGGESLNDLPVGTGAAVSDASLFALSQPAASWTYYKRSATPIRRSSQPHPETHALVRYNVLAATQLDAAGKVRAGASFPDSAIIVKELSNGTTIMTYAVMMKVRGAGNAGLDGWVWAEFGPNGAVRYPANGRGAACTSCHAPGIDYTRMNDSQP